MASAEDYANWIVANPDKKGTPEFDTVARAYQAARQMPAQQEDTTSFKNIAGAALEPMMHLGSGGLATVAAGLGGLGAMFNNAVGLSDASPADVVRYISDKGTYQPKTQGGTTATNFITSPLHAFSDLSNRGGENIAEATGSPLAGALANAGPQAALALLGGREAPTGEPMIPALNRGVEAVGSVPGAVATGVKNLFVAPSAGKVMNDIAGSRAPDVIKALLDNQDKVPGSIANAGEAAVPAGSAEFAALQQAVKQLNPSDYLARDQANKGARVAEIQSFGKGPDELQAAQDVREAASASNYPTAYENAIKADPVLAKIGSNPFFKKEIPDALELAKSKGIDPKTDLTEFLHFVKIGLDDKLGKTGDTALNSAQRREVQGVKSDLVDWLGQKNPDYEFARSEHARLSDPINVMRTGQAMEGRLSNPSGQETRAGFLNVLDDPTLMLRKQGIPQSMTLEDVIGPQNYEKASNVGSELERNTRFGEQASAGGAKTANELRSALIKNPTELPGFWKHGVRIAQAIIDRMHGKAGAATMEELSSVMQDPQKTAQLMQAATPMERAVIDAMLKNKVFTGGAVAAGEQ